MSSISKSESKQFYSSTLRIKCLTYSLFVLLTLIQNSASSQFPMYGYGHIVRTSKHLYELY